MNKAEQAAVVVFAWGTLVTAEPVPPLDQLIVREARSTPRSARTVITLPVLRPGDNRGPR
jgi:hypothetical protein